MPSLDVDAAILQLMNERSQTIDASVTTQTNNLQQINLQIKYANALLTNLRKAGYRPSTAEVAFLHQNKIPYSASNVAPTIAGLQILIGTLAGQSQLNMLQLKSLIDKQNQTLEMMSNLANKNSKTMQSIIGNMR